eukprot:4085228-Alexandrium_andersonii.AAC.1
MPSTHPPPTLQTPTKVMSAPSNRTCVPDRSSGPIPAHRTHLSPDTLPPRQAPDSTDPACLR